MLLPSLGHFQPPIFTPVEPPCPILRDGVPRFLWIMVVSVPAFGSRARHHIGVIRLVRRAVGTPVLWHAKCLSPRCCYPPQDTFSHHCSHPFSRPAPYNTMASGTRTQRSDADPPYNTTAKEAGRKPYAWQVSSGRPEKSCLLKNASEPGAAPHSVD
jgi:hypothetical protein